MIGFLRRDVLERAWDEARRNRGAAGVDRLTIQHVEQYGIDQLVGERYQRGRRYGWVHVTQHAPNCLGLISLNGRVIAPRANRPWRREGPNALGEGRR